MNSSTNFHYFDLWEFVAPVLFIILWYVIINRCSRSAKKAPYTHDRKTPSSEEEEQAANKDSITEKGELLRPTPAAPIQIQRIGHEIISSSIDMTANEESAAMQVDDKSLQAAEPSIDNNKVRLDMEFCRYYGKKIESDSTFCKYCGKKLRQKSHFAIVTFLTEKCTFIRSVISRWENNLTNKKRSHRDRTDKQFVFSKTWRTYLGICILLLLSTFLGWLILLKYQQWMGNSYDTTFTASITGLPFVILAWFLGSQQERKYRRWRKYILWSCVIIASIWTMLSVGCFTDVMCSDRYHRYKVAKEMYEYDKALESSDPDVLNHELNRRFEDILNKAERSVDRDLADLIHSDEKFFEVLNKEARRNNGVAQGIMGEYYSCIGIDQIKRSGEMASEETEEPRVGIRLGGSMTPDKLYQKGVDNMDRAFYWWKKASENQDARGLYRMGDCYAKLIQIDELPKDLNQAYQYWTKASEKGYGMAYKRLGDLYTWEYLDGIIIDLPYDGDPDSEVIVQGIDSSETVEDPRLLEPFPLPKGWKYDISKAREYWQKAVDCGGDAAEYAMKCLEKVYPEEKKQNQCK